MAAWRRALTASSCCCSGEPNLREVNLFPMNQQGEDLMMGAPSEVDEARIRELHIRVALPPAKPAAAKKAG
jgi:aspartyl-tRNA synthetase